ncbi:hypothetical protein IW261DRAFT_1523521 [Armillaria novae-zelandiae]|uniref:protein-tyrosine-phosphatase n=1 Tax=Armillaria novae-zelandiae TaxID=153914 RepID=A0AA39NHC8_9AGAR|nr:hypothetical protein IW261DRAFT_1523521 [Armillaria novae-zelandiae]
MDFFSAANDVSAVALTQNDTFAQAIASSFGSFTARLPSVAVPPSSQPTSTPKPTLHSNSFHAVQHSELTGLVNTPSVLFIDIRPHAQFSNARLPNALSLSVPSTLLKRPMFSLDKLASMLSSSSSRSRFLGWNTSVQIVVYDADSTSLPDSSNILGLLRKFANDNSGYSGKLCWLQGGFQSVWRDRRELIDQQPLVPDPTTTSAPPSTSLNPNLLPTAAFRAPKRQSPSSLRAGMSMPSLPHQPFNPFFDTIRQNIELSHGITERIPLKLTARAKQRLADLPFSWLRNIALRTTSELETDVEESMESLAMQFYRIELAEQRRLMGVMEHHSRESLVQNHSERKGVPVKPFPFSITAGVEKGAKNRYRHIWPFEHARVRLHSDKSISPPPSLDFPVSSSVSPVLTPSSFTPILMPAKSRSCSCEDTDDYVNASYVQPLCTRRRYIATQGPLEATFVDFWTLVWQQNVHVIVMLTREIEGSTVKCNCYWKDGTYGSLHLRLISCEGKEDGGDNIPSKQNGGFFNFCADEEEKTHPIIKRTFLLTHSGYPHSKPRRIVHYQYLEWPDMNVPDDPRGVLELIKEVGRGMEESVSRHGKGIQPLLLHCSAGVGRTGGFIAVDAVLDGIRREIRKSVKDQVKTAENKAIEGRTDSDGDIVMDETGQRTMPMPPNKGGDVLHVPVIDNGMSPSTSISQRESEGDDTATRRWAENLEHIDSAYSRDVGDSEGRSSFETASLSTASSSEESSSFFPRTGPKNECKENDGEISPNATSSGYTTSSSFVTTIASEPSSKDGVVGTTKKSFPSSNSVPGVDFKTLLSARLGEEETSRARTQSAPVAGVSTKDGSPFTSRSLSPSGSDMKDAKDLAAQSTPNLKLSSASTTRPLSAVASTSTTNVDYKDPRPMHRPDSPRLLSSCDEPLWEVVQDMREQRMSLCQSLRQYVFVHAAVIEGALMVADEEKEALGAEHVEKMIRQQSGSSHSNAVPAAGPVFVYNDILTASSSSHGKRGASPTELLKEDKMGELRMSKRPSIKRKQRSHDSELAVYSARDSLGERLTLPTFEIEPIMAYKSYDTGYACIYFSVVVLSYS